MKAAVFESGTLSIRDCPTPEPDHEQARVRITAAGVCHSDLHIVRGHIEGLPETMPIGHEAIGVVEALGPGAERFVSVGDRVILGLGGVGGGAWCGACEFCLGGEPRLCDQNEGLLGAFAQEYCVWAKGLVRLPGSVGDEEAPLACGGITAFGAVKKLTEHRVGPGRRIAIVGAAGGLGHYAVQIAKAFGYKVVGIDLGEERLEFIESLGAELAVDAREAASVVLEKFGGVHASLVFSGKMAGFDLGFEILRRRGLFVAVGIPPASEGKMQINPSEFFMKAATLVYAAGGNIEDMRQLVEMAAAGTVKSHVGRTGALSELPAIFDDLEASRFVGRAVITNLGG